MNYDRLTWKVLVMVVAAVLGLFFAGLSNYDKVLEACDRYNVMRGDEP